MSLSQWHTTAADNASAGTINWAEGMNPGSVNDSARQTMSDLRTWYEDYEWRDFGHSPTFASASSFTLASAASLSSTYCVNRRLRITDSVSGTAYGTISATTWVGATQTVTLSPLTTALNTTTAVALGINPTNSSVPVASLDRLTAFAIAQAVLTTPGDMIYASSTATAARLAVGATANVLVTNSSLTPTWTAGLTLTSLSVGSVNVVAPGLVLLGAVTAAASTTVDFFTGFDFTTYDEYEFHVVNLVANTSDVFFGVRAGYGVTPTWDAGANYAFITYEVDTVGNRIPTGTANASIALTGITSQAATMFNGGPGWCGVVTVYSPSVTTFNRMFRLDGTYYANVTGSGVLAHINGAGWWINGANAITGIRFVCGAGNFTSGVVYLFGRRKA